MPLVSCKACAKEFYIKPSHLKLGWGKYCSKKCQIKSQFNGGVVKCFVCDSEIYRSKADLKRSSSGKYFCSKSCQTLWRNQTYVGEKSRNWKTGEHAYRGILKRSGKVAICFLCKITDERVIIAHHRDHNRNNNHLSNLIWLCLNCHFLAHHDKQLDDKIRDMEALV